MAMLNCNCGAQNSNDHRPHDKDCNVYADPKGEFTKAEYKDYLDALGEDEDWLPDPNVIRLTKSN